MHSIYVARLLCNAGRGKLGVGHPGYHAAHAVVSSQPNPLITSEAAASKTKQSATSHRVKQAASKTPATSFLYLQTFLSPFAVIDLTTKSLLKDMNMACSSPSVKILLQIDARTIAIFLTSI